MLHIHTLIHYTDLYHTALFPNKSFLKNSLKILCAARKGPKSHFFPDFSSALLCFQGRYMWVNQVWLCTNSCPGIYNLCYLLVTKRPAKHELFFQEKQLAMHNEIMDYCYFGTSLKFWQGCSGDSHNLSWWLAPHKYQGQEQSLLIIVQRNSLLVPFMMSLTLWKIIAEVKMRLKGDLSCSKIAVKLLTHSHHKPPGLVSVTCPLPDCNH